MEEVSKTAFDLAIAQLGLLSIPGEAIPKLIVKEAIDPSKIFIPSIMAEYSEHIPPAIEIIDRSIDLGNLIKIYLRPEYKDAANALSKNR